MIRNDFGLSDIIKDLTTDNTEEVGQWFIHLYLWEWKPSRREFNNVYQKTKIFITIESSIPLLRINPEEIVCNIDSFMHNDVYRSVTKNGKIRNNLGI